MLAKCLSWAAKKIIKKVILNSLPLPVNSTVLDIASNLPYKYFYDEYGHYLDCHKATTKIKKFIPILNKKKKVISKTKL